MIELVGDKAVRDVAWEVVPDLAEAAAEESHPRTGIFYRLAAPGPACSCED